MDLSVYFPVVMTYVVALSLDEISKAVVPYMDIKDLLYWSLSMTVGGCGGLCQQPGMELGSARDSLTMGNTECRPQSWGGRVRWQAPCLTQASTLNGLSYLCDSLEDG
jgi:hypothetical protein